MKKRKTFLIKFAGAILHKVQRRGIRLYSSKYSWHDFTQHQHIVLLAVRQQRAGTGYRRFLEEDLPDLTAFCEHLHLEKIPHFTTLHKAAKRFSRGLIDALIAEFLVARRIRSLHLGIDATGFSPTHASHHYTRCLLRPQRKCGPGRPRTRRRMRRFLHLTQFVELRTQLIAAASPRRGPRNDSPLFIPTAKKVRVPQRVAVVEADRGYDAEKNFAWTVEKWKAVPRIRLRNASLSVGRTRGRYRKAAKRRLHRPGRRPKNHRNKCETAFSVIKRCFGEAILATSVKMQNKEILFRLLAYNARKAAASLLLEVFYGAGRMKTLKRLQRQPPPCLTSSASSLRSATGL